MYAFCATVSYRGCLYPYAYLKFIAWSVPVPMCVGFFTSMPMACAYMYSFLRQCPMVRLCLYAFEQLYPMA